MAKYIIHPDEAAGLGRWIIEGEEKDGNLKVTKGPAYLIPSQLPVKGRYVPYDGELEPQQLSLDDHLAICDSMGVKETRQFLKDLRAEAEDRAKQSPAVDNVQDEAKKEYMAAVAMKPQTMKGFFLDHIYQHGLFEDQAVGIFKKYESSDLGKAMQGRWNEPATNYSDSLKAVTWLGMKKTAVAWIDENMPQHWARAMFTDEVQKKEPTLRDWAFESLTERGLSDKEANAILEKAKAEPVMDTMKDRWEEALSGHAPTTKIVFSTAVDGIASKWLADNKPDHWARPMFAQGPQDGTKPS